VGRVRHARSRLRPADVSNEMLAHLNWGQGPVSGDWLVQTEKVLVSVKQRLDRRLEGPLAQEYEPISEKLAHFSATRYAMTADAAREATVDLVGIVRDLKDLEERLGVDGGPWELADKDPDHRAARSPDAVIIAATALQDVLAGYHPAAASLAVEDLSLLVDSDVRIVCYRKLPDERDMRRVLRVQLTKEARRMGVLPTERANSIAFIAGLVDYIMDWTI
jgi:hypothetical protein